MSIRLQLTKALPPKLFRVLVSKVNLQTQFWMVSGQGTLSRRSKCLALPKWFELDAMVG